MGKKAMKKDIGLRLDQKTPSPPEKEEKPVNGRNREESLGRNLHHKSGTNSGCEAEGARRAEGERSPALPGN